MEDSYHTDISDWTDRPRHGWWASWGESSANDSLGPEEVAMLIEDAGQEFAALFASSEERRRASAGVLPV